MPSQVAEIFDKGPGEHTVILNTRCQCIYPFDAPDWTDLRVAFLLSLTQTTADDTITGLTPDSIGPGNLGAQEFVWIGVKTNNDLLPGSSGTSFIGFSNWVQPVAATSELVSSDGAIGTTNTNFWRPRASIAGNPQNSASAIILDSGARITFSNVNAHFAQNTAGAGGYATLLMLRIVRDEPIPQRTRLTVTIKQGTNSGDVLFTNTPTLDLLENNMANYPAVVQTKVLPIANHIPNALYLYWPFSLSRLRCHALGFMKFH